MQLAKKHSFPIVKGVVQIKKSMVVVVMVVAVMVVVSLIEIQIPVEIGMLHSRLSRFLFFSSGSMWNCVWLAYIRLADVVI